MKKSDVRSVLYVLLMATASTLAGCGGSGTPNYTISGTVRGLDLGNDVTLVNNDGDPLTVSFNGGFTFSSPVAAGGTYTVTVKSQPEGQICTATSNSGLIVTADINNVLVTCADSAVVISGSLSGLAPGQQITLLDNMDTTHALALSTDGSFTFPESVALGSAYSVTVANKPLTSTCAVTNGTGNDIVADIRNISVSCVPETVKTIYSFDAFHSTAYPNPGLVADSNGNLYGTAYNGGRYGHGSVFMVTPAGIVSELYSFAGGVDGSSPQTGLTISSDGSLLYGTTQNGGPGDNGTVFSLTTAAPYTKSVLHSFMGGSDGINPYTGLLLDSAHGELYGTTEGGGTYGLGTVFRVSTTAPGNETVLYSFAGGTDGANPVSNLVFNSGNNVLYGTTELGGANNAGTVFALATATNTESIVYSFAGAPDGANPVAGLAIDAFGRLYGTTMNGGENGAGTLFNLTASNGTENIMYSFANGSDGGKPMAGVVLDPNGTFVYGTTSSGGTNQAGTVFAASLTSTTQLPAILYSLPTNAEPHYNPQASLLVNSMDALVGTSAGGTNNDGAVFMVNPGGLWAPASAPVALYTASTLQGALSYPLTILNSFAPATDGLLSESALVSDASGNLYGTTMLGGANNLGAVFKITATGEQLLYSFAGGTDGAYPKGKLVVDTNGNLYGTTTAGGTSGDGTVFMISVRPTITETVLHSFSGGDDGSQPYGGLVSDNQGTLYGTTCVGGANSAGTVFKISRVAPYVETVLYSFSAGPSDGNPEAGLVIDSKGNLYGSTFGAKASKSGGSGTVFKLNTSTGVPTVLHTFGQGTDGFNPKSDLVLDPAETFLYGTTAAGGANGQGTVYKVATLSPYTESVLYSFSGRKDGGQPSSNLVMDGSGNLYGTTIAGGTASNGTLFKLTTASPYSETVLYSFTAGTDGGNPVGGLLMNNAGNTLYGTTALGGAFNGGTVYQY